jgi:hypothetical protein
MNEDYDLIEELFKDDFGSLSDFSTLETTSHASNPALFCSLSDWGRSEPESSNEMELDFPPLPTKSKKEHARKQRKSRWTASEDMVILELVQKHGHAWKYFTSFMPERPPDSIKSRYYSNLKKHNQIKPYDTKARSPVVLLPVSDDDLISSLIEAPRLDAPQREKSNKQECLEQLYSRMAEIEKLLARTYVELDRVQETK